MKTHMTYFDAKDGVPEQAGKVVGDVFSALVALAILWLIVNILW